MRPSAAFASAAGEIERGARGYRLPTAKRGETAPPYLDEKNTRSRARAAARSVA